MRWGTWVVVASAFVPGVDWRRLRIGGGIVVAGLLVHFVGTFFQEIPVLGHQAPHDYRSYFIFLTLSELLAFVTGVPSVGPPSSVCHQLSTT